MPNKLIESLDAAGSFKTTENGQLAYDTTGNPLLDLFGTIGAMRGRDARDIQSAVAAAYAHDRLRTLKCVFYARDIRGGLGERLTFRIAIRWLAKAHPEDVEANFPAIAAYGRWDDFYALVGTPLEEKAFSFMRDQFESDLANAKAGKHASLLGKWLKSCNATSETTRELGRLTAKRFGLSERGYRKALSLLRSHLGVVEVSMSANQWGIDYETVPSKAMAAYAAAFRRHDAAGFAEYLGAVRKGEAKINGSTLYPYDLVERYIGGGREAKDGPDEVVEVQWRALPDYVGKPCNFIVMADISGSMTGRPMAASLGLAIYFAQRNRGAFANSFMTLPERPSWVEVTGESLLTDLAEARRSEVGYSTDLARAFDLVLSTCVANGVPKSDLPKAIVAITDMEIDEATRDGWRPSSGDPLDFTSEMAGRFAEAGYEMPTLVWWNVSARNDTFHAKASDRRVRYVSGSSASSFARLVSSMGDSPEEMMLATLDSERYAPIRAAE